MATRKMTKKTTEIINNKVENSVEENQEEVQKQEEEKPKKEFSQSDGVMCRSVVQGGLFMEGLKTGMLYNFIEYGDICEIEYRDLVAAVRSKSVYVFEPRFIIEDEDFIAEFPQITKFYNEQFSTRDLKKILAMDVSSMVEAINNLPKGAVDNLKTIAATQVANGLLDSVSKIKALDKIFGTELDLVSSVFPND